MKIPKDYRLLVRSALDAGWVKEGTSQKSRLKLRSPAGALVVIPCTPSSGKRAFENKRAELRRAGVAC